MKTIATIAAVLLASLPLFAQDPTPDELKNIRTVAVADINKAKLDFVGKIVRIRFAYRGAEIGKNKSASHCTFYICDDSLYSLQAKAPIDRLQWVTALPVDEKKRTLFVYARITQGKYDTIAEFVGREIKTDMSGPKLIW